MSRPVVKFISVTQKRLEDEKNKAEEAQKTAEKQADEERKQMEFKKELSEAKAPSVVLKFIQQYGHNRVPARELAEFLDALELPKKWFCLSRQEEQRVLRSMERRKELIDHYRNRRLDTDLSDLIRESSTNGLSGEVALLLFKFSCQHFGWLEIWDTYANIPGFHPSIRDYARQKDQDQDQDPNQNKTV